MSGKLFRKRILLAALATTGLSMTAQAQWFGGGGDPCGCSPVALAPAPVVAAAPSYQMAAAPICQPLQPIQETVYKEVPVTAYRPVKKTVQRPVYRTVYEDREVTAYRPVTESRTVEVPTVQYQTVTEYQPQVVNRSYWKTTYQPVPKTTPCEYDRSPGVLGWWNRTAYGVRSAFTPNYIPRRELVPQVYQCMVPRQRTVAVPSTRQVTYNVSRLEPYKTTQKVAVQRLEYEEQVVTVHEPYTTTQTVAVGTTTRYAAIAPFGGGTATAIAPTPARSANQDVPQRTAENPGDKPQPTPQRDQQDDVFKPLSYPTRPAPQAAPVPQYREANADEPEVKRSVPSIVRVSTGWKSTRGALKPEGPQLSVAANE
ncbi:hypothetical protein Mal4_09430 [Maioricimonas rarisocia]|uniref:Uncharacterized protein n=1 Tax=Maioricimonas rarisocia TaxID=2528026 RepID=A0A517Z2G3_9PLAN|nr:hypothetical protein [Maioricimonas rarisocia]QDU36655.1 hypothetical protein Mal4_09430 [Maioricimonas rarisocia]